MASKKPHKPQKGGRPDGAPDIPTSERLRYAQENLASVRHTLEDYLGQPNRLKRLTAVRSFATRGVSVTWTLQKLRHREPDFEEWYAPWRDALAASPVARFFYGFRTISDHEGQADLLMSATVEQLSSKDIQQIVRQLLGPGGGAWRIAIGDAETGDNYIEGPDGRRVFFDYPGITSWESLKGVPASLADRTLPSLMQEHVFRLSQIVDSAMSRFGGR